MGKSVLCAIDFSASSLQGLKWALKMAQLMDARMTVLFCYRLIGGDEDKIMDLKRNMENDAIVKFSDVEKKLINGSPVVYEFVSEVGFFPFRIEMFLRKSPVDLLIIGNSIIQNFNEYRNSSFEQFLTESKIPVLVVPEDIQDLSNHRLPLVLN